MSNEELLKNIIPVAAPFIKSIVDTFVSPNLERLRERLSLDYKKYIIPNENHFQEYLTRSYSKYSILNTLVFSNSQRLLKDVYIPLNLSLSSNKKAKYLIDGFPKAIVNTYKKILVTDTAGMGKSTMMKKIFLDVIDSSHGIPIMIELRRLSKDKSLIQELHEQLNSINKEFDEKVLLELIQQGSFIFILDGYDEIPLADRESVTSDIQMFISKAGNNQFLLTSRPESALSSFGDFQQFHIEPLETKEAFELLRKYDNKGEISRLLIDKLNEPELMKNVEEFLTNPLLVSLLFTAFEHKQTIPFKKHIFYRQVYDANFESHDFTKGDSYFRDKHSKLDIDDFHRVLRHIGFSCLKNQKIEFSKDEILNLILLAKQFCVGVDFNESNFFKDLASTVPLFTQDGTYYKWAHKSIQEYFAAQFIYLDSKEHQNEILERISNGQNVETYMNVLDLYYEIDYKGFRNIIIYSILKEFREHLHSSYKNEYGVDISIVKERQELTFCNGYVFSIAISLEDFAKADFETPNLTWRIQSNDVYNLSTQKTTTYGLGKIKIFITAFVNQRVAVINILGHKKMKL